METALLSRLSDIYSAVDNEISLLAPFDVSGAFDMVDYQILPSALEPHSE